MAKDESAAEELVELGIEIVNPGGRPDVLRDAAKAWRKLQKELSGEDSILKALDKNVSSTVGNTWRGEAAEAFQKHWREFKSMVEESVEEFDEVAKGLDEAADAIEECNDAIHQIYLEIGITAAVGVATSFFSFGLTGAAAAANIARLAGQAIRIAGRLGTLLQKVAAIFRRIASLTKTNRLLSKLGDVQTLKKLGSSKLSGAHRRTR
jgi:WXG100 family type VII secretion target